MSEQVKTPSNPTSHPMPMGTYDSYRANDEIDLVELFMKVWNRKFWVIGIGAVTTACALAYALLATPIYEFSIYVKPPTGSAIIDLKDTRIEPLLLQAESVEELLFLQQTKPPVDVGFSGLSTEDVFFRFLTELNSYDTQYGIFKDFVLSREAISGLTEIESDALFNAFGDKIVFGVPELKKGEKFITDTIAIRYTDSNRESAVALLNEMVARAEFKARAQLINEMEILRLYRIENNLNQIDQKLLMAELDRLNLVKDLSAKQTVDVLKKQDALENAISTLAATRDADLAVLSEAIGIAKTLGITKPTTLNALVNNAAVGQVSVNASLSDTDNPLYLRGTEFLQAEYQALKNRRDKAIDDSKVIALKSELLALQNNRDVDALSSVTVDESYIWDAISPLKSQLTVLKGVDSTYPNLAVVRIDKPAQIPKSPIKPKKTLIVLLGGILGGMLGVFISLVVPTKKEDDVVA